MDGDADQDDVTRLVQDILNTDYGDANLDLSVDLADFNTWLTTLPPTVPLTDASALAHDLQHAPLRAVPHDWNARLLLYAEVFRIDRVANFG